MLYLPASQSASWGPGFHRVRRPLFEHLLHVRVVAVQVLKKWTCPSSSATAVR